MQEPHHPSGLTPGQLWYRYTRYPALLAKLATFILVTVFVFGVFHMVQAVLVPVLTALLIAYLLDPVVDHYEERGWSRSTTIGALMVVGTAFIFLFLLILYPTLAHQVGNVVNGIPTLLERFETDLLPWLTTQFGVEVPHSWSAAISQYGAVVQEQLPGITRTVSTALADIALGATHIAASAINIVMIPVFTFYFLRDFDHMRLALVDYLPVANRPFLLDRIQKMDEVVGAWFRGQVEVASILAALYAIGLAIVFGWAGIGISAGLAIGLLSGILNIIPYFGFVIGFGLSVLMVLLDWAGIGPLIGVCAVFAIVQTLEGYVITPRIVGEKVGLSPVVVIIALLLGGELLGLVGILLALPVAGIVRVLWPDVAGWYRASSFYTGVERHELVPDAPTASKDHTAEDSSPA